MDFRYYFKHAENGPINFYCFFNLYSNNILCEYKLKETIQFIGPLYPVFCQVIKLNYCFPDISEIHID